MDLHGGDNVSSKCQTILMPFGLIIFLDFFGFGRYLNMPLKASWAGLYLQFRFRGMNLSNVAFLLITIDTVSPTLLML